MNDKEEIWTEMRIKYQAGLFVTGKVTKKTSFGVFLDIGEIKNYTLGLIHLSQIIELDYQIDDSIFDIGKNIKCEILGCHGTSYLEVYLKPLKKEKK